MKKLLVALFAFVLCSDIVAQDSARHKIALFTPLYLDSVFDAFGNYRFDNAFPGYAAPGLEFYQGAQLALDSLHKRGAQLDVFIYDSRSRRNSLSQQLNAPEMQGVDLIIGQSNIAETKLLADAAMRNKIPFVSATLPNDAGVSENPYFVLLNSTLQTHIEGMYRYMQKYHPLDRIIVFRKNGTQENQIRDYLSDFSKITSGVPLKIEFIDVNNNFSAANLSRHLDSTKKNVVIAGSLEESFGTALAQQLGSLKRTFPITLFGMPTWDNFNFSKAEFNNIEVIYTTPFYYSRSLTPLATRLTEDFTNRMSNKPTDMFYRGYETVLRFGLLLLDTGNDMASNLSRKGNTIFTPFDIQPVFKDRSDMVLDYFENKKLYFIKVIGGVRNIQY
jgi:ABC-type branched-subunit amino acid transport system substrate-binding protein